MNHWRGIRVKSYIGSERHAKSKLMGQNFMNASKFHVTLFDLNSSENIVLEVD